MASNAPQASDPLTLYSAPAWSAYSDRLIHAFTGRPASLGGPGTPAESAERNRHLLCERLGVPADRLRVPQQVHGRHVATHRDCDLSATDGVAVLEPGVPVLLQFADCTPILLYDPVQHVGAVVHAGWRGTALAIAQYAVQALVAHGGVNPSTLVAAIGPAIGGCCYTVDAPVVDALAATLPHAPRDWVVSDAPDAEGLSRVDLQQVNAAQLRATGIREVSILPVCTRCHPETLWSHRRGDAQRQGALLCLLPLD